MCLGIDFSDKDDKIASDESDSKRTSITVSDPRECGSKRAEGSDFIGSKFSSVRNVYATFLPDGAALLSSPAT